MDDVSKLSPFWVNQLRKEVATRRNRAAESLLTLNPDGTYAEQHRILIKAANTMLAAPDLLEALQLAVRQNSCDMYLTGEELRKCEAAIAKATGSAST